MEATSRHDLAVGWDIKHRFKQTNNNCSAWQLEITSCDPDNQISDSGARFMTMSDANLVIDKMVCALKLDTILIFLCNKNMI